MMAQMHITHIIHRPHWRWMRSGCSFSIFVSTLPIPLHSSHLEPGLQLQNYLFVPWPHDFDNNLYKNTKNRDNNFICEGCWKLKLMICPQGREEEDPQFVQSNCDHRSILFRLTDQSRIWIKRNCSRGKFNCHQSPLLVLFMHFTSSNNEYLVIMRKSGGLELISRDDPG